MIDRFVRQIAPQPKKSDQRFTFDNFASYDNIVLLGDPGAGKTHLFEQCAKADGNQFIRTRNFLNIPSVNREVTLFIDALDEKRSGPGNEDVVDKIVQKLFSCPPKRLRISCRSQDWLGESDLSAFLPYFEQNGGYVVLHLEQLSKEEQITILQAQGIEEPETFIYEAESHSVTEFLHNPHNLIMLAKTVKVGDWPKTRTELFQFATDSLLTEENNEHANYSFGIYNNAELEPIAGAICALRLLSDVGGISLKNNNNNPDYPSYRTIPFYDRRIIRAALSRRIFTAGDEANTVDYSHRTIAEYLAAKWLVGCVRKGLPIGRLRSLIGYDGYPSSELRGLHAWLAVFLPEHTDALINADPYGILTYGDATSLTPSNKHKLLIALSKLSEKDPWFRTIGLYSSLKGFIDSAVAPIIHKMLIADDTSYSLRMIILESLSVGAPIPALKEVLLSIVKSKTTFYPEKKEALTALIHLGEDGKKSVVEIFHSLTPRNVNSIRLCGHIIHYLYKLFFSPRDISKLLITTINISDRNLPIGTLWSIVDIIPTSDIHDIFCFLYQYQINKEKHSKTLNYTEVSYVVGNLLSRIFDEDINLSAKDIWQYLSVHQYYCRSNHSHTDNNNTLRNQLKAKQDLFPEIIDEALLLLDEPNINFSFWYNLNDTLLNAITLEIALNRLINFISTNKESTPKTQFLYRLSFNVLFLTENPSRDTFEILLEVGKKDNTFADIKDSALTCEIEDWRKKESYLSCEASKKKEEQLKTNKFDFNIKRSDIISASDLEWLADISILYFSLSYDLNRNLSPIGRIELSLGRENVSDAIQGLKNLLNKPILPSFNVIVNAMVVGEHPSWWYAILAGSDEIWNHNPDINIWNDEVLQTLLALDLLLITPNKSERSEREWLDHAIKQRTDTFMMVYSSITSMLMTNNRQSFKSLRAIINNKIIPLHYRTSSILEIIRAHPNNAEHIVRLLSFLLCHPDTYMELTKLFDEVINGTQFTLNEKCHHAFLISSYLIDPDCYQDKFELIAKEKPEFLWLFRELSGFSHGGSNNEFELSLKQLESLIAIASTHFPYTHHPRSSSGDRNAWDGSEFIVRSINKISAISSIEAGNLLIRLLKLPQLSTYKEPLLHALSNQQSRRRESLFQQADWKKTIHTLSNQTPANVTDLHCLVIDHLKDISYKISNENSDIYKNFWNEGRYGKVNIPKSEETGRDVLLNLLRAKLQPLGIICEPEGHMVADKRADLVIQHSDLKIPIELKRDYHKDVWTAALNQLDRLYTRDPYSAGYGIYAVFWYGEKRAPKTIPRTPHAIHQPTNAKSMEEILNATIPTDKKDHIFVIVIDVSGDIP